MERRNKARLQNIRLELNDSQEYLNLLNQENGSSTWLTYLTLKYEEDKLSKQKSWHLIRIRYGCNLSRLFKKMLMWCKYCLTSYFVI